MPPKAPKGLPLDPLQNMHLKKKQELVAIGAKTPTSEQKTFFSEAPLPKSTTLDEGPSAADIASDLLAKAMFFVWVAFLLLLGLWMLRLFPGTGGFPKSG